MKPGVDAELDERRRVYDGIGDLLSTVARDIAENVPAELPVDLSVIFFPQIGFLIAMPLDPETRESLWEGYEADLWEKMFTSEVATYYKSSKMRELDGHFGDIYGEICGRTSSPHLDLRNEPQR